jgi:hypothetical protein
MKKYPIDPAAFIAAREAENGKPLDPKTRELWTLLADLQNTAYEAGRKDGFMECFKTSEGEAPPRS